jgi:hypothetical protein
MKIIGTLRGMIPKLFRWGVISRWLIALCFWAVSMQLLYPVLSPWPLFGLINTLVIGLCLLVLVTRLAARFTPEKQIWMVIKPVLNIADVIALAFITCGLAFYLNGVFGEQLAQPQVADIIHISEERTRFGPWWPAGRVKLAMRGSESSERYLVVDDFRLASLLPGATVTVLVHQGAFRIPWVELQGLRIDNQLTVASLVERGIKDQLVTKWAVQNELTAKRFKQAMKLAQGYFEQEPDDFYFAMSLADGAVRDGNSALGVQIMEPFVKRYNSYKLYCSFASFLGRNHETSRSLDYLKAAISMDPDEPEAYYLLGHTFKNQGRREESMAAFTKLVQLQPQYSYLLK